MKISVVIPTLNEEKYVGNILQDLQNQTRQPDEIIVVDANSKDQTIQVVSKYKDVKIISTPPSIPLQRNVGGKQAKGDIIIFLDADCRIEKDFIQKTITEFEKRNLDIACAWYICETKNPILLFFCYFFNTMFVLVQKIIPSGIGAFILVKNNIFLSSKGFDETLKFEDIEFIRRVGLKRKFAVLNTRIYFSPRRFYEEGVGKMIIIYLLMAIPFTFGIFRPANIIPYKFGNHR